MRCTLMVQSNNYLRI